MSESGAVGGRRPGRTLLVGCGSLGTQLGLRLVAEGNEVIALRRTTEGLPAEFAVITDDLSVPRPRELPGCDSVVITLPPGAGFYRASLTALAEALPERPSRFVFVSSTRVLEGSAGETPLTEETGPQPTSPRARELRDGELVATELLGACIVRPAGIYGPGRESLIRKVREQAPVDYSRRTNRVHQDDLVGFLHMMLTAESPPALVHAVDQAPSRLGDVVTFIAERLGVEPPPHMVPEVGGGTVLDGSRMHGLVGALEFPSFREGYERMLSGSPHPQTR
ncbi:nucleoside-diphosphate-sugar epimerase [Microbacterium natoriense]|uniref:Nucleoside-diphosphate-sugar epimerase n=1 Tax=Microbacterium natoriense TaxID=284570 RepID=A0AAW8F121_9MICO|nr:SDR family NAD(P)-dependent oxidoreductase [Microbacterium natoriense]MDQ0649496.1 nucleoside-diphosphate-sugar epimerase [Microbacterium natoriense]